MNICDFSLENEYFGIDESTLDYISLNFQVTTAKMTNFKVNYKMIKNVRRGTPTDIPPYERHLRTL